MRQSHYDIAIVGAGLSGLSTAWHIQKQSNYSVCLIDPNQSSPSLNNPGLVFGSFFENYTRFTHTFGNEKAKEIRKYTEMAFRYLGDFCQNSKIEFTEALRIRVAESLHEKLEMKLAVKQLKQNNFEVELFSEANSKKRKLNDFFPNSALQLELLGGGYLPGENIIHKLKSSIKADLITERVVDFKEKNVCYIKLENGDTLSSTMAVFTCGMGIGHLETRLSDSLIPYCDQWHRVEFLNSGQPVEKPYLLTFQHGNIWILLLNDREGLIGGARFLRPLAGVGENKSTLNDKQSNFLDGFFKKALPMLLNPKIDPGQACIDIRPCDELPIIGPMFGSGCTYAATGYMGIGLSLGFFAGKNIAELILRGECRELPRSLWPERLRSLNERS
ncbi:MAG: FAD-binding oxidoreductase [Oligoflexales bacterium]|nr:FAD-binding oxidoreductase [Oligoflexales bacterium]